MKENPIKKIEAREILDSRGNPTVEVELETGFGFSRSAVPSGASTGKYEAIELRDGEKRYAGKGVLKAVNNVIRVIAPKIIGRDVTKQKELDELMIKLDGTENKSRLGANAICPVSLAICRAGAKSQGLPPWKYISELTGGNFSLPQPLFNIINGGAHAGNELDFQEFMIAPEAKTFKESLRIGSEIYHQLKKEIKERYGKLATNVGDEGGFAPPIEKPEEAIEIILEASKNLNYEKNIKIIIDVASSQFFSGGKYKTKFGEFDSESFIDYYLDLVKKYPILGLEDPMAEEDREGWKLLRSKIKNQKSKILIIGDDLLVTNPRIIKEAKEKDACNAMILKVNQIGTVSEALEAAGLAKSFGWEIVVSHRSGETDDDFIADLAVGIGAKFIKSGAPARGERVAKYNRLLRIEEIIG